MITCDIMGEYITCVHVLQDGYTPLYLAARYGHHEAVKILTDGGATVDTTDNVSRSNRVVRYARVSGHS